MYEQTTETVTPLFSADEERRYRALCLAIQATDDANNEEWNDTDTVDWAKCFEAYLRGPESEKEPSE